MYTVDSITKKCGSNYSAINFCEDMVKEIKRRLKYAYTSLTIDRYKTEITDWQKLRIKLDNINS